MDDRIILGLRIHSHKYGIIPDALNVGELERYFREDGARTKVLTPPNCYRYVDLSFRQLPSATFSVGSNVTGQHEGVFSLGLHSRGHEADPPAAQRSILKWSNSVLLIRCSLGRLRFQDIGRPSVYVVALQ